MSVETTPMCRGLLDSYHLDRLRDFLRYGRMADAWKARSYGQLTNVSISGDVERRAFAPAPCPSLTDS